MTTEQGRKMAYPLLFLLIASGFYAIMREAKTDYPVFSALEEPVLILDAGHGGADGGASSASGLKESEVNLDIVLRMRELCRFLSVPVLLTRDTEDLHYPPEADTLASMKRWDTRQRVDYINKQKNAVLLSIHQNYFPDPRPRGPQIFFSDFDYSAKKAEQIQFFMTENLYPTNRRVASPMPAGLYIPEHADCPAILCECAFLSNPEDAGALATETYRTKIAVILMAAYLEPTEDTI